MKRLVDSVTVMRRFRRSIRIDTDIDSEGADGFICTHTSAQALKTTFDHVSEVGHGAFTWTGPYGCGKSSLAVILASVLGPEGEARKKALSVLPDDIVDLVMGPMRRKDGPWRVIPVSGRREDAITVLSEAFDEHKIPDGKSVIQRLVQASKSDAAGCIVIIDEMGKLLEHAVTNEGDAFLFQELAEAASRSEGRLVVIGILHQAFDDYAYRLARETRDDWLKVQGRFVDVALAPLADEQLGLLSRAIKAEDLPESLESVEIVAKQLGGQELGQSLIDTLMGCWPLNPVVSCLLGPLSRRRFGQNQRSLFGFLGSAEPAGFQEFLQTTYADSGRMYDTDWLWNYLRANLESTILASPDGHRWSLAIDAIERCEARGAEEIELRVAKAIALIDNFRERSGLTASPKILQAALPDLSRDDIEIALEALSSWSVAIYRRHLGGYSLFAGSDFDIEAAIKAAADDVAGCDYGRLRSTGVFTPVLAKRHYHLTGSMRWFEVDVSSLENAEERVARFENDTGAVGLFLLLINEDAASKSTVQRRLQAIREAVGDRPIVFGLSTDSYMLRENSLELLALERVQASRPELKGDPVARREVASRASRLAAELEDRLRSSLSVTHWHVPPLAVAELEVGEVEGSARLSLLASKLADALYPCAPRLRNELVNRSKPSPNAMAAMKALMVAMISSGDRALLGMEGYPPERGLYEALLGWTGVHTRTDDGYVFSRPYEKTDDGLAALWDRADEILENAGADGIALSAVYSAWRDRPFGLKDGLLPVLSLAFILSRQDKLSTYLDGGFCASLTDLFVDRMLQDPTSVRLRLIDISDRYRLILHGIASVTANLLDIETPDPVDPLTVGRQLVAVVTQAPAWVRRTGRMSPTALKVRDLAQAAHDPNKFMLDDLPRLFDPEAAEDVNAIVGQLKSGLEEIGSAYRNMLTELRKSMLRNLATNEKDLAKLQSRAKRVIGITGNYRLDAFSTRIRDLDDRPEAMEGLASLAANKPPRDWADRDMDAAQIELAALAQEFLRAEGLAYVKGGSPARTRIAIFIADPGRAAYQIPEFSLDEVSRKRAQALADELKSLIDHRLSPSVILAALAELGADIATNIEVVEARGSEDSVDTQKVAS